MRILNPSNRFLSKGGVFINCSCNTGESVEAVVKTYSRTIYRVALHYLKNQADAEDIVHDVFMKWLEKAPVFTDDTHEKAWFIRVTVNACKDLYKSAWRSRTVGLDDCQELSFAQPPTSLLDDVTALPPLHSTVIYLHYYEGYSMQEIAAILHKTSRSVESLLYRARLELKQRLEDHEDA